MIRTIETEVREREVEVVKEENDVRGDICCKLEEKEQGGSYRGREGDWIQLESMRCLSFENKMRKWITKEGIKG